MLEVDSTHYLDLALMQPGRLEMAERVAFDAERDSPVISADVVRKMWWSRTLT
tara:strand:+ start:15029 stop:15187 length:159 start_codon:yes stop_codon:yes gene_type:complete